MNDDLMKQMLRRYYDKSKHNFITISPGDVEAECSDKDIATANSRLEESGYIETKSFDDQEIGLSITSGRITDSGIKEIKKLMLF